MDTPQKQVPEVLLSHPQVGGLSAESSAMHPTDRGEEVGVVSPDLRVELCIPIQPQVLAHDLHREHPGVGERRLRAALPQPPLAQPRLQCIVYHTAAS